MARRPPGTRTSVRSSCIRAGSPSRDLTSNRIGAGRMAGEAPRSGSEAHEALEGHGPGDLIGRPVDRPGTARAVEVAGQDERAVSREVGNVVGSRAGSQDGPELDVARTDRLEIGQLANRVWKRSATARTG